MGVMRTAWRARSWRGTTAACVAILIAFVGAGCRNVDRAEVASWREAVATTSTQSSVTFDATNELVRDSRRQWLLVQPELLESNLRPGLDAKSIARWNAALRALTEYASAVEVLLAPETSAAVGASAKGVSERIGAAANTSVLKADGALSKAVGRIAERIADAAAKGAARDLMLEADADVRVMLNQMSDMLLLEREDVRAGVVVTVETTWNTELAQIEEEFRVATTSAARGPILDRYIQTMARRDRATGALMSLRGALLNLASAHSAAANGRVGDVNSVIEQMRNDIAAMRSLIAAIRDERETKKLGGVP